MLKQTIKGFSLIELSALMLVVSLVAVAVITTSQESGSVRKAGKSYDNFEKIHNALARHAKSKGFYPCPAEPGLKVNDNGFGVGVGSNTGVCTANILASNPTAIGNIPDLENIEKTNVSMAGNMNGVYMGMLPFVNLGLSYQDVVDGWDNRIMYSVSQLATKKTTYWRQPAITIFKNLTNDEVNSVVTPTDNFSNHAYSRTAAYVLVSTGVDGVGAYNYEGIRAAPPASITLDSKQQMINHGMANATVGTLTMSGVAATENDLAAYFIKPVEPLRNISPTIHFDDIVEYREKYLIDPRDLNTGTTISENDARLVMWLDAADGGGPTVGKHKITLSPLINLEWCPGVGDVGPCGLYYAWMPSTPNAALSALVENAHYSLKVYSPGDQACWDRYTIGQVLKFGVNWSIILNGPGSFMNTFNSQCASDMSGNAYIEFITLVGWADKSGNGNDAFTYDFNNNPIITPNVKNGLSAVQFVGADNNFLTTAPFTGGPIAQPNTIIVVSKRNSTADFTGWLYDGGPSLPAVVGIPLYRNYLEGGKHTLYSGTKVNSAIDGTDGWEIHTIIYNSNSATNSAASTSLTKQYVNGKLVNNKVATGNANLNGLTIGGAVRGVFGITLDGYIGEFIVFDGIVDGERRYQIEKYLSKKWAIDVVKE